MATRAATFYPSTTDQDFSATGEVDVRKLVESIGGSDNTTVASFGTGTAEIVLDPYTTRSTTGTSDAPNLGWAINRDGSDGMTVPTPPAGVDSAVRFIAAGTWTFNGRLGAGLVTTGTYRLRVRVYKVASDGSRSLLFGPINSSGVSPTVAGVNVSATTSQSEITFDEDECLLVSYSIEKTAGSVTSESIQFRLNDGLGNDCEVILPAGPRTRWAVSGTVTQVSTVSGGPTFKTVTGTVYDTDASPASGVTVKLFDQSDDTLVSEDVTDGSGVYVHHRAFDDTATYYCVAFQSDTEHGTSDGSLAAS